MSKPKHYWYGIVKKMIMTKEIREGNTKQGHIIQKAMHKATQETLKLNNGRERMQAVEAILIKQTDSYESYALKASYDRYTIVKWVNSYINMVGSHAGY